MENRNHSRKKQKSDHHSSSVPNLLNSKDPIEVNLNYSDRNHHAQGNFIHKETLIGNEDQSAPYTDTNLHFNLLSKTVSNLSEDIKIVDAVKESKSNQKENSSARSAILNQSSFDEKKSISKQLNLLFQLDNHQNRENDSKVSSPDYSTTYGTYYGARDIFVPLYLNEADSNLKFNKNLYLRIAGKLNEKDDYLVWIKKRFSKSLKKYGTFKRLHNFKGFKPSKYLRNKLRSELMSRRHLLSDLRNADPMSSTNLLRN